MPATRQRQPSTRSASIAPVGSTTNRYVVTLLTAAGLFLLFGLYCFATLPLTPKASKIEQRPTPDSIPEGNAQDPYAPLAKRYIPHAPWAASAGWKLETDDHTRVIFFNEWKQESDNVVQFRPFAMIAKRLDAKPDDPPYTVDADKAYITFKSKFNPPNENPGAIVRAGLEKEVQIQGPNGLKVWGNDFFFEREANRIYSDRDVRFQFDRHKGTAVGIQIELIRDEKAKADDSLAIAGVSSVKLLKNVDMILVSDSTDQIMGGTPTRKPAAPTTSSKKPEVVHAKSDGSFNFVLATHVATFERNVRIRREAEPGKFDSITADEFVEITFDVKNPKNAAAASPKGPAGVAAKSPPAAPAKHEDGSIGGIDPNLKFKKLRAQGKLVQLVSDTQELQATMRELEYDQVARTARLKSAPKKVEVFHHANQLYAPEIVLNHDEQGQVTDVACRGEGNMRHFDEKTKQLDLTAEWLKEMRKYPDPKSAFDLIDLEDALVEQPKEGAGIAANHMRLWVVRQQSDRRTAVPNRPPAAPRSQTENMPQIDHMLAWQNVAAVSPQMELETEHLEIWFEPGTLRKKNTAVKQPRSRANLIPTAKRLEFADTTAESEPQPLPGALSNSDHRAASRIESTDPGAREQKQVQGRSKDPVPTHLDGRNNPAASSKSKSRPGAGGSRKSPNSLDGDSSEPYQLKAAVVHVRVLQGVGNEQPQVAEVVAQGSVHLEQSHGEEAKPLMIDGNDLHLLNHGELDQDMTILGQPAHVRDRGAHIEGSPIRFNRATNIAQVEGSGQMQIPLKQTGQDGVDRVMPLDVTWNKQMHFDGLTANFVGLVHSKMDDGQAKSEIRCRNMQVLLDRKFSFSEERHENEQPKVETVHCKGGVEFESDSTVDAKQMEIRRGRFVQMTLHQSTGKATAEGPGMLRVWRHSENGPSGLSQISATKSNAPPKTRKKSNWEFMQIKFDSHMDGDFSQMTQKQPGNQPVQPVSSSSSVLSAGGAWRAKFYGNVQILYGPVDQAMEVVDRDDLLEESGWLGCEEMEVDQHPQTESEIQHITLEANGNSRIEGKTFRGEAETITYDGSTNLYVLRGGDGHLATIYRQVQVGGEWSQFDSSVLRYNSVTNSLWADGATTLDAIEGPKPQDPAKSKKSTDQSSSSRKKRSNRADTTN